MLYDSDDSNMRSLIKYSLFASPRYRDLSNPVNPVRPGPTSLRTARLQQPIEFIDERTKPSERRGHRRRAFEVHTCVPQQVEWPLR